MLIGLGAANIARAVSKPTMHSGEAPFQRGRKPARRTAQPELWRVLMSFEKSDCGNQSTEQDYGSEQDCRIEQPASRGRCGSLFVAFYLLVETVKHCSPP